MPAELHTGWLLPEGTVVVAGHGCCSAPIPGCLRFDHLQGCNMEDPAVQQLQAAMADRSIPNPGASAEVSMARRDGTK